MNKSREYDIVRMVFTSIFILTQKSDLSQPLFFGLFPAILVKRDGRKIRETSKSQPSPFPAKDGIYDKGKWVFRLFTSLSNISPPFFKGGVGGILKQGNYCYEIIRLGLRLT